MSLENFNALINGNMADIEDLPDFVNPATGTYAAASVKCELGERDGKQGKEGEIKIQFSITAVLEEVPTAEQEACIGNVASARFYGEYGVKQFKKLFAESSATLGFTSIGEMINHLNNGQEFALMFKQRVVKVDAAKQPLAVADWNYYSDVILVALA